MLLPMHAYSITHPLPTELYSKTQLQTLPANAAASGECAAPGFPARFPTRFGRKAWTVVRHPGTTPALHGPRGKLAGERNAWHRIGARKQPPHPSVNPLEGAKPMDCSHAGCPLELDRSLATRMKRVPAVPGASTARSSSTSSATDSPGLATWTMTLPDLGPRASCGKGSPDQI